MGKNIYKMTKGGGLVSGAKKIISLFLFTMALSAPSAYGANVYTDNYVVFFAQGDCHQEDCISALYGILSAIPGIAKIDASSLASHDLATYKPITVSFTHLKDAPYEPVMKSIASLGYTVISYVIHDTHVPHQDIIIPH